MGTEDQMAFRMRTSKFRHVYGSPAKKEHCFEGVRITKNAHDGSFCAVNPKFLAIVTESAGGGTFVVIQLENTGRVDANIPKVCGHTGPILDIKWSPFNDHIIASSSDDTTVKLWRIPAGGLVTNLTEWLVDLHGHTRRVGYVEWHPTAENILLSAGFDFKCILWNTELAEPINIITVHNDTIFSMSWNHDGSLFATTCKDKKIRVFNPREGTIVAEGVGHQGSKISKVLFLDKTRLFTTGFSRQSDRQFGIWDTKNLSKPLKLEMVDSSSGALIPFYDKDTNIVFIAGRGDGNVRYYEIVSESPYSHYLSQFQSGSPQRSLGIMPKRGVDPLKCEIVRFYKLNTVKSLCEPISMIVPRKSEIFQDDIFPPTASSCPSLSVTEWLAGENRDPIMVSLKDGKVQAAQPVSKLRPTKTYQHKVSAGALATGVTTTTPSTPTTESPIDKQQKKTCEGSTGPGAATGSPRSVSRGHATRPTSVAQLRRQLAIRRDKDGSMSNNPSITTYKAMRRSGGSSRSPGMAGGPQCGGASAPKENLPSSLRNIRKLSTSEEERAANSVKESHSGVVSQEATTRLTNTHQPMRVNKKVWSPTYHTTEEASPVPHGDHEPAFVSPASHEVSQASQEPVSWRASSRRGTGGGTTANITDVFSTPPSSPNRSRPSSWQENPLYGRQGSSSNMDKDRSHYVSASSNISNSPFTPTPKPFTPDQALIASQSPAVHHVDTQPLEELLQDLHNVGSSYQPPSQTRPETEAARPWRVMSSDANLASQTTSAGDVRTSQSATDTYTQQNGGHSDTEPNSEMLEWISSDAPDNTLMKPSKLRASMRSRKHAGRQTTEVSGVSSNGASEGEGSSSARSSPERRPRTDRRHTDTVLFSPNKEKIRCTDKPEDAVTRPAHVNKQDNFRTKTTLLFQDSPYKSSPEGGDYRPAMSSSTAPPPSAASPDFVPNDLPHFERLGPLRSQSFRESSSRGRWPVKQTHVADLNDDQRVHVKKVWSPQPAPSLDTTLTNGVPSTDVELRKAYFQQVEEIRSLKERVSLKDKRIRQLEEELRSARSDDTVGESTC